MFGGDAFRPPSGGGGRGSPGLHHAGGGISQPFNFTAAGGGPLVARVVSKFRGVTWDDEQSKWLATAYEGASQLRLGLFENQEDAARFGEGREGGHESAAARPL